MKRGWGQQGEEGVGPVGGRRGRTGLEKSKYLRLKCVYPRLTVCPSSREPEAKFLVPDLGL